MCQNLPNETSGRKPRGHTKRPDMHHKTGCIIYCEHIERSEHNKTVPVTQPFHDEKRYDSLACIHEHISFHNPGMGIYDNSLVNVSSYETSG